MIAHIFLLMWYFFAESFAKFSKYSPWPKKWENRGKAADFIYFIGRGP